MAALTIMIAGACLAIGMLIGYAIKGACMSKYNLLLFVIIIAAITWNMFSGNLFLAIIDVGFLCAFLLSLILIELVALNKQKKR